MLLSRSISRHLIYLTIGQTHHRFIPKFEELEKYSLIICFDEEITQKFLLSKY